MVKKGDNETAQAQAGLGERSELRDSRQRDKKNNYYGSIYLYFSSLSPQPTHTCQEHYYDYRVLPYPNNGVRKLLQDMLRKGNPRSPVMHLKGRGK